MSILDLKIKELIDQLDYSDSHIVRTDRKSVEFIMNELVDFALDIVVPMKNNAEIEDNIELLKA